MGNTGNFSKFVRYAARRQMLGIWIIFFFFLLSVNGYSIPTRSSKELKIHFEKSKEE